jgi:hypothetical protein
MKTQNLTWLETKTFAVIVGNIGTVLETNNTEEAHRMFVDYSHQSRVGYGRAAGEEVTLMTNGEPTLYTPGLI